MLGLVWFVLAFSVQLHLLSVLFCWWVVVGWFIVRWIKLCCLHAVVGILLMGLDVPSLGFGFIVVECECFC